MSVYRDFIVLAGIRVDFKDIPDDLITRLFEQSMLDVYMNMCNSKGYIGVNMLRMEQNGSDDPIVVTPYLIGERSRVATTLLETFGFHDTVETHAFTYYY